MINSTRLFITFFLIIQVEGLLDEKDFRVQITREQFEKLNEDLFNRVKGPIQQALDAAGTCFSITRTRM